MGPIKLTGAMGNETWNEPGDFSRKAPAGWFISGPFAGYPFWGWFKGRPNKHKTTICGGVPKQLAGAISRE